MDEPRRWTWDEFRALPSEEITRDIHCVTKWTKLDTTWRGVSVETLLDGIETSAEYVVQYSDGGYTTNLPLEDLLDGKAWVAFEYEGEPLEPAHGGPARMLVPHLYFWKSAKWVRGLRLRPRTNPASGRSTATTTTETHGGNSGTGATDLAVGECRRRHRGDAAGDDARLRHPGLGWSPGRAARRRPADGRGRISDRSGATRSPRRRTARASP